MSNLKLIVWSGLLAAAIIPLHGCGSECGPGTTQKDGQCLVEASGCGTGTILSDKKCVVNDTGCGAHTTLQGQTCVPVDDACEQGATYDKSLEVCVANTDIVCGPSTEDGGDGLCVPSADACGPKTSLDGGRCVVEAAACGAGTELAPNTGICELANEACGDKFALDADTGTCVPTDKVCDTGAKFDAGTGLCLPDACQQGDILVDGVCKSTAKRRANNADLAETENNDPALGGTAESLTVNAPGEAAFTFTGTIGAPAEVSDDDANHQDLDVYEFQATAGDWFELSVESVGLPAPAFTVSGPDGYTRQSGLVGQPKPTRQMVAPADGAYRVTVLPSLALQNDQIGPSGDSSWRYVGSIESLDTPTAVDTDPSGDPALLNGDFTDLTDNLYNLTGLAADSLMTVNFEAIGPDVQGVLQVWSDATTLAQSRTVIPGDNVVFGVPSTGAARVLVDWTSARGSQTSYDMSAHISGKQSTPTLAAGSSDSVTVTLDQFDRLIASQSNPSGADLGVSITNAAGDEVAAGTLADGEQLEHVTFTAGAYTVTTTNNTSSPVDPAVFADITSPVRLGQIAADSVVDAPKTAVFEGETIYYTASVKADQVVTLSQDNDPAKKVDYTVYDQNGDTIVDKSSVAARSNSQVDASDLYWSRLGVDKTLVIAVELDDDVTGQTFQVRSSTPPQEGTLASGGSLSFNHTGMLPQGFSGFHLVDIGASTFYGALTANGGGNAALLMYDSAGDQVVKATGDGGPVRFGGTFDSAKTVLVRVRCDQACSGYGVNLHDAVASENLGSLAADSTNPSASLAVFNPGQTYTINFSAPAGQIIKIYQDNADSGYHNLFLYDGSGAKIRSDDYFRATSENYPHYEWWYTEDGGSFELKFVGDQPTTAETFTIESITPDSLGSLTKGNSVSKTVSASTPKNDYTFHLVDFATAMDFSGDLSPANGEDLDLRIYDLQNARKATKNSQSGGVNFNDHIGAAGSYLVLVEHDEPSTGYTLTLTGLTN